MVLTVSVGKLPAIIFKPRNSGVMRPDAPRHPVWSAKVGCC